MMPAIMNDIIVSLACKGIIWLIRFIATQTGADDLIFMLIARIERGGKSLGLSLLSLLGAAVVDRLLWLRALVDEFDAGAFILVERRGVEMSLFYLSAAITAGFLDLKYVEHFVGVAILTTSIPLAAAKAAVPLCFLVIAYVIAVVTRYMMEMPERPPWKFSSCADRIRSMFRRGVALLSCIAAVACVFSMVLEGGQGHALREVGVISVVAVVLAYLSSILRERSREKRRTDRIREWGPAGRPFGRRDLVFRPRRTTR